MRSTAPSSVRQVLHLHMHMHTCACTCTPAHAHAHLDSPFEHAPGASRAKAVLWRLNEQELLTNSDASVQQQAATLTLEHVLPQKPQEGWRESWPDKADSDAWCHRLGNLVLLNHRTNAAASNKMFVEKKPLLAKSPYPLTRELADKAGWSIVEVQAQQKRLIELASVVWELQ